MNRRDALTYLNNAMRDAGYSQLEVEGNREWLEDVLFNMDEITVEVLDNMIEEIV